MRVPFVCALIGCVSATSFQLDNCETVDEMREDGENTEQPELFREYVVKCIAEIDAILNVDDWPRRMSSIVHDILEHFDGYDAYDEPLSYEERCEIERELEEGVWTDDFVRIALASRGEEQLIQRLVPCYTSGYGSRRIERSLNRDARNLANEFETEKPKLRLRKELMQLDLDSRRRSARIADKKRKRLTDETLSI